VIEEATGTRVAFITRLGEGLIPDTHTVLQEGDLIHVTVRDEDIAKVEIILARSPKDHS
jgi:trk system potassium uptake protein TrkA